MLPRWAHSLLVFAAFLLHFSFAVLIERFHTSAVLLSFGALWMVFLIQWADREISVKRMIVVGMLLRGLYLLVFPELSDDVFRYIWDGMLVNEGISPYSMVPSKWAELGLGESFGTMLHQLNSPEYYSVYPPMLQYVFAASVWLGDAELLSSIIYLRVFVLLTELGSMVLLHKLLKAWQLNERNLMLYALNPLVIIEFAGNLHGEVFMVFFLLLSLWLLVHQRQWLSSVVFAFSVGTKLLPLMFLPFYVKRLGWSKTIGYAVLVALTVVLLYAPFWHTGMVPNILSSIRLYFANFEFNGSVYLLLREAGYIITGYNQIALIGRILSLMVLASILLIAWWNKNKQLAGIPVLMMFAWFIYYALATTVNPWYVAALAAFLPFTKYRFALVWLITVPLSYHAFGHSDFKENVWMIALEYVPVYVWLAFELDIFRRLERKWALRRAEVKRKRLLSFLSEGETVLEVGSGNGALVKLLRKEGMKMSALDIADKSLFDDVAVEVYDGARFPFIDRQFDVCQLITMLHHTTHAEELVREAKRVSGRVIIMEDIYVNAFQRYITWFTDSIVNWEFYGHPHTNRTDAEWKSLFERNGLRLEKVEYYRFLVFFTQVTYVLRAV